MTLHEELQAHFNAAATKYPAHAYTFMEELGIYKGALVDNNPLCIEILQRKSPDMVSCRPSEVVEVFNQAYKIFAENKGQKI